MISNYFGIDPGLSGGLAVIASDGSLYKIAMPTITFGNTKDNSKKTEIDRKGVLSFLQLFPAHTHVVIEKQEAFRGQDIVSGCTICKNYGMLLMALTVARFYITEVSPGDWQAYFGIVSVKKGGGKTTKQQAYKIAQAKYPNVDFRKSERARTPHDGMVDATLIATYCQSLFLPSYEAPKLLEVLPILGVEGIVKPLECSKPGGKEPVSKLKKEKEAKTQRQAEEVLATTKWRKWMKEKGGK